MTGLPRRSFLKILSSMPVFASFGFTGEARASTIDLPGAPETLLKTAKEVTNPAAYVPGYLSIIQGPTSDTETLINVVAPRLKKYVYSVVDANGFAISVSHYATVTSPTFFSVNKLRVSGLTPGAKYELRVNDGKLLVDRRTFSSLNTKNTSPNFALISCMADDRRFDGVIDPMWAKVKAARPEFLIFCGDAIYVDSFEFVDRLKGTEFDLWQRYIDTLRRIPLYHWTEMVPIFATWDDHDFGTNDGDKTFQAKEAAKKLFDAIFGGPELKGVWQPSPSGVANKLTAFGQSFYFMDNRSFRQPNKETTPEDYGHWGKEQHAWLLDGLSNDATPAWIVNGNQCFNGVNLSFKESFEGNSPKEFSSLMSELSKAKQPVVFASGDVHITEIMRVPKARLGYETYEFTSSSLHSFAGDGWDNPMRMTGAYSKEFNFLMIRSEPRDGGLKVDTTCIGLADRPYFQSSLNVIR
ncbi:MAG: hypothetical protein ABL958_06415 [Bdellovibrionia bacterium]